MLNPTPILLLLIICKLSSPLFFFHGAILTFIKEAMCGVPDAVLECSLMLEPSFWSRCWPLILQEWEEQFVLVTWRSSCPAIPGTVLCTWFRAKTWYLCVLVGHYTVPNFPWFSKLWLCLLSKEVLLPVTRLRENHLTITGVIDQKLTLWWWWQRNFWHGSPYWRRALWEMEPEENALFIQHTCKLGERSCSHKSQTSGF